MLRESDNPPSKSKTSRVDGKDAMEKEKRKEALRMKLKFALNKIKEQKTGESSTMQEKEDGEGKKQLKQTSGNVLFDTRVGKEKSNESSSAASQSSKSISEKKNKTIENSSPKRENLATMATTVVEGNRASSASDNRPKARPCPLSKKRKLEELAEGVAEPEVIVKKTIEINSGVETLSFPSSSSPSHLLNTVQTDTPTPNSPKRIVAPCPRSKKPKLEVQVKTQVQIPLLEDKVDSKSKETKKSDSEISSVVPLATSTLPVSHITTHHNSIQKTETKKLSRPCPRSKKSDFTKDSKRSNEDEENNSCNNSFEKDADISADLKMKISLTFGPTDSHEMCTNDKISTTVVQSKETKQIQTHNKKSQVKTPAPEEQSITNQILATKWKDSISQLQQEIGTPEESLDVIMSTFSSKILLRLQQAFNSSKPLYLFELILPHIWMDLDLHDLLQCRQVCKRWASAVDCLLSNRPDQERTSDCEIDLVSNRPVSAFKRSLFVDHYNRQRFTCQLISLAKVQSVYSKVKDHPRNPFVTRSVLVRANPELNEVDLYDFWASVKELFRVHGEHVWHIQLDIQGYHSLSSLYKLIQHVLNLIPNLRTLELLCHSMTKSVSDLSEISARKPLPNLPFLQTLDLNGVKCPTVFSTMFIKQYATSLKNLRVSLYRWNEEDAVLITNLKDLHITAMCSRENLSHLYSSLQNLQHLDCLSKLSLTVIVPLRTSKLFGILQHFKGLREIKIILLEHIGEQIHLEDDSRSDCDESPPILPQVYSIEVTLTSSQKSFRFLKWFPSLQTLHLAASQKNAGKDEGKHDRIVRSIRRCIVKQSAVHSSIWSLLPSLHLLTVALTDLHDKQSCFYFAREMCQIKNDKL